MLTEKFNIQGFGDKTMEELLILLPFNMTVILSLVPGLYMGGGDEDRGIFRELKELQ